MTVLLLIASVLGFPGAVSAQPPAQPDEADELSEPEPGRPSRPGLPNWPAAGAAAPEETETEPEEQRVPRVEAGYTHFVLTDGYGAGDVHAGVFGGFLPFGPFRAGVSAELGSRSYTLGQDDFLARAVLALGYRHLGLGRLIPYAGAVFTFGLLVGKRFSTPRTQALGGGGVEIGADVRVVGALFMGVSLSYQRIAMGGVGRDAWVLRLRLAL